MKRFILNNEIPIMLCFVITTLSCNKDVLLSSPAAQSGQSSTPVVVNGTSQGNTSGATQISGRSFLATTDDCDYVAGAAFALKLIGDLEGCWYVFIDEYECSPSGTYRESGSEYFIGTYKGEAGSFRTGYKFEGKYQGCSADGAALGLEIFGRCQHPIAQGSGTGVFENVSGRFDFKDDIAAGNFPYRGHLSF